MSSFTITDRDRTYLFRLLVIFCPLNCLVHHCEFQGGFESINYMTMPDEHLHYNSLLDATAKVDYNLSSLSKKEDTAMYPIMPPPYCLKISQLSSIS